MTKHKTEMESVMTELFEIKDTCDSTRSKLSQTEEEKINKLKTKFENESGYFQAEANAAQKALDHFGEEIERRRQFVQWGLWGTTVVVGGACFLAAAPVLAAGTAAATVAGRICIPRCFASCSIAVWFCIFPTLMVILSSYNSKLKALSNLKSELRKLERDFLILKKQME